MICPLCCSSLRQNLLLPPVALLVCPNELCVYPLNLSPEELARKQLVVRTDEEKILKLMQKKMDEAGVEKKVSDFIVRPGTRQA